MSLLSICIPTYKRLPLLKEVLTRLLPQAEALGISVFVSDNNSQDGSSELLAALAAQYSCLRFRTNPETVSIDENMFCAIQPATTPYIFPLGDDDFLPDGTLSLIVAELSSQPDLLALASVMTDPYLKPKRHVLPQELRGASFKEPMSAFRLLWDKMPFGSFVARRDCFTEEYFTRYIGTSHAYTGAVWDKLAEKYVQSGKVAVHCMAEPTVLLRGGEKTWKDSKARILLCEIPKWFTLLPEIYAEEVLPIKGKYLKKHGSAQLLLSFRRSRQLRPENCEELMTFFNDRQQRMASRISSLPALLANVVRFFVKRFS